MPNKKNSAFHQLLFAPISLPVFSILALIGTSLISLNLSLFLRQPPPATVPTAISQNTLQNVLGTSFSIGDTPKQQSITNDPTIHYWQEIVQEKDNYRDAYITLAISSFNKRNCHDTKFYLDRAYDVDPDSETLQELIPHLKSCLDQK